jgi:hypothetical protein
VLQEKIKGDTLPVIFIIMMTVGPLIDHVW